MNRREKNTLEEIKAYCKNVYGEMNREHHNWGHIMRVWARALIICETESVNEFIVLSSVLLHDIGYRCCIKNHALAGSRECRGKILPIFGLSISEIHQICHCIEAHDPDSGIPPGSIESRVVHDADLLEKSDWPGIIEGRFDNVAREFGLTTREFSQLFLRKFKPFFYTEKAREMDNGRLELIIKLYEKTLWQEK